MLPLPPLGSQIEAFFARYEGIDGKFELVDGQVVDRRGGSVAHAEVCGNLLGSLADRLRGTGLKAFNGQMGLWIDPATVFYPDVAIYGDRRDLDLPGEAQLFRHPKLVVEVTPPATSAADLDYKLSAYKALESLAAIVLVDPLRETIEIHDRRGPDAWHHERLAPGSGLTLRDPAIKLSFAEIFASD